ncbi:amino acid permease [Sediminitomix flava]|uniref:Cation-chloride cotransporter (CCC family) n=1 Tax=Sediminitomix flava TaxID=379075 RepID=A0A315ZJK8_SEDFL|nr:amino acid permease [Sediminitomix flava]PWJ44874.1 cation-chloride cotransporter (CCC family) [Sediminitomix flava]
MEKLKFKTNGKNRKEPQTLENKGGFGTIAVFLTSISTILGAILFLRFGYAVGHLSFWGCMMLILLGHTVTIPTALSISEIATNQKVQGGGVYYIISRSFGFQIGGAIGIALYLSQAISTAFYIIAFAEAFNPVLDYMMQEWNIYIYDLRLISIPSTVLLTALVLLRGASLGIQTLYIVVAALFFSLVLFFGGGTEYNQLNVPNLTAHIVNPDSFFHVFAICFPAFTGMAAGVGLSGDLKNPSRSIPLGTMLATIAGMLIYMLVAYKLTLSASPTDLAEDEMIMSKIALWGPIIPIGLGAAAFSSAIGSILVAPRTLQAIAEDKIFPLPNFNAALSKTDKRSNEPFNANLVSAVIALIFVLMGDIDVVAQIITMFFMVTYGAICMISFLEHFASDPSYRPVFRSKWFISCLGAVSCVYLMFKISVFYALSSIVFMTIIYQIIGYTRENKQGLSNIFQGVIFQLSRQFRVFLQKAETEEVEAEHWRPSIVCISDNTFKRLSAFSMVTWLSHKYGFGTYIHILKGYLSRETHEQSEEILSRLIKLSDSSGSRVYLDTLVTPSFTSAIAQVIQLPGISGKENNMILFEFSKSNPDKLNDILDNFKLITATNFDTCILASAERNFGYRQEIHIWLTPKDFDNANLMILLGFIILGHPEWRDAKIKLMVLFPENDLSVQQDNIENLIAEGRLPINKNNIFMIPRSEDVESKAIINERSNDADLTILGIRGEAVKHKGEDLFLGYDLIGDILFVHTNKEKVIQ